MSRSHTGNHRHEQANDPPKFHLPVLDMRRADSTPSRMSAEGDTRHKFSTSVGRLLNGSNRRRSSGRDSVSAPDTYDRYLPFSFVRVLS